MGRTLLKTPGLSLLLVLVVSTAARGQTGSTEIRDGWAPAGGVELYYRVVGEGRPLLLINGGPGWSSDHMLGVAERLAASNRVILYDQRGTGGSQLSALDSTTVTMAAMVEDIEALRRHLGIDAWAVMGHSFGGMLALAYAAEHPETLTAMVLSAPAGASLDFLTYYEASLNDRLLPYEREAAAFWSDPERMAAAPRKATYELLRASLSAFLYHRERLDQLLAVVDEDTWSTATAGLVWADLIRTGFDVREGLEGFDRPVLVVQGRQDALGDLNAHQVAELFPDSRLEFVEESAHLMWIDQPGRYFDIVSGFLDRTP